MAEDPIIVTGGSVSIDLSDKIKGGTGGNRKKYKNDKASLLRLEVNGVKIQDLKPKDVVTIVCDDGD